MVIFLLLEESENLLKALYEILGEDAANIMPVLVSGGCGLGAAIAAAIAE